METDRYGHDRRVQPVSLAAALVLSGVMVSGLVMSSPAVRTTVIKEFVGENIPIDPPPPPDRVEPIRPKVRTLAQPTVVDQPIVMIDPVAPPDPIPFVPGPAAGAETGAGLDPVTILPPLPSPTPAPVLTGVTPDPRYARDLQPPYPPSEERAGRGGLVTVRVLVGPDGRVRQVERVAAASEAFFAATERQALTRWRFRPATRDGVAIDAWRVMTVRFEIPE